MTISYQDDGEDDNMMIKKVVKRKKQKNKDDSINNKKKKISENKKLGTCSIAAVLESKKRFNTYLFCYRFHRHRLF